MGSLIEEKKKAFEARQRAEKKKFERELKAEERRRDETRKLVLDVLDELAADDSAESMTVAEAWAEARRRQEQAQEARSERARKAAAARAARAAADDGVAGTVDAGGNGDGGEDADDGSLPPEDDQSAPAHGWSSDD